MDTSAVCPVCSTALPSGELTTHFPACFDAHSAQPALVELSDDSDDDGGSSRRQSRPHKRIRAGVGAGPQRVEVVRDFVTAEEEATLVAGLLLEGWFGQGFGGQHTSVMLQRPFPRCVGFVVDRLAALPLSPRFRASNGTVNVYRRGGHMWPHIDTRCGPKERPLMTVSLLSSCQMTFRDVRACMRAASQHRAAPETATWKVELPRRSLVVTSEEAKAVWTHEIKAEDLHGEYRISITFREDLVGDPQEL
eukprot:TRINITY_DN4857_c0_g1_i6.p1 TRINITY_DN4857_c0_g1~~TRINITY_DN4857_c0_g1_i6.p1  ORF type:complete len:250 (-),score=44.60 TRINITY_DN4857_c0_g1_i6:147-896(-)